MPMVVTGNKYFNNNTNKWLIEGDGKEKHKCEKGRRLSRSFDMEFFIGDFFGTNPGRDSHNMEHVLERT